MSDRPDDSDRDIRGGRGHEIPGPSTARNVDQAKVFYQCETCDYEFQDEPNKDDHQCPHCLNYEVRRC